MSVSWVTAACQISAFSRASTSLPAAAAVAPPPSPLAAAAAAASAAFAIACAPPATRPIGGAHTHANIQHIILL
jgi:hypothetical protein